MCVDRRFYDLLHVGNFRGAIFFQFACATGSNIAASKVKFIYNYTDVDDKIINRAKADGVSSHDISGEVHQGNLKPTFNNLKLRKHSANPHVTGIHGSNRGVRSGFDCEGQGVRS